MAQTAVNTVIDYIKQKLPAPSVNPTAPSNEYSNTAGQIPPPTLTLRSQHIGALDHKGTNPLGRDVHHAIAFHSCVASTPRPQPTGALNLRTFCPCREAQAQHHQQAQRHQNSISHLHTS
jgi:hypothetical protein